MGCIGSKPLTDHAQNVNELDELIGMAMSRAAAIKYADPALNASTVAIHNRWALHKAARVQILFRRLSPQQTQIPDVHTGLLSSTSDPAHQRATDQLAKEITWPEDQLAKEITWPEDLLEKERLWAGAYPTLTGGTWADAVEAAEKAKKAEAAAAAAAVASPPPAGEIKRTTMSPSNRPLPRLPVNHRTWDFAPLH